MKRNDNQRTWELAKAKDGVEGEEHVFSLSIVDFGTDEDGDPITSCVVVQEAGATESAAHIRSPSRVNEKIVYAVARELIRKSKHFGKGRAPASSPCIQFEELIEVSIGRLPCEPGRQRERAKTAARALIAGNHLMFQDGWLWGR